MKHTITLLALLIAGITSAFSQTNTNIAAYNALRVAQGNAWNPGGAEVLPIVEAIVAQPTFTTTEAKIVGDYYYKSAGPEQQMAMFRTLASKNPWIAVAVKFADKDATGWTQEMMKADPRGVMVATMYWTNRTQAMMDFALNHAINTLPRDQTERDYFKGRRKHLSNAEQIAMTAKQKALLLAKSPRSDADNAWLAEVSADLIALSLDQTK
jgi:hypothetical protein